MGVSKPQYELSIPRSGLRIAVATITVLAMTITDRMAKGMVVVP
jgi:hypothetical protein